MLCQIQNLIQNMCYTTNNMLKKLLGNAKDKVEMNQSLEFTTLHARVVVKFICLFYFPDIFPLLGQLSLV